MANLYNGGREQVKRVNKLTLLDSQLKATTF